MDTRLIALKLLLDKLNIADDVVSFQGRKRVQKAVYLGQRFAVDLSYRFAWDAMGPFSVALARDYYTLAEAVESGDSAYKENELQAFVQQRLDKVLELLTPPTNVQMNKDDWIELIASYDYLKTVRNLDIQGAEKVLKKEKPNLIESVDLNMLDEKLSEYPDRNSILPHTP